MLENKWSKRHLGCRQEFHASSPIMYENTPSPVDDLYVDKETCASCLAFNYAKLVFWLVSFAAIVIFVYLYSKDIRERRDKSWQIANELEIANRRLNTINAGLREKMTALEVSVLQKNAQINTLEQTTEELRKRIKSS